MRIRILAIVVAFASLGACAKTESVRIQNDTDEELFMRVSVDHYMDAYECSTQQHVGAFNREGLFTVDADDAICLVSDVPKGDKEFDIRERVRNLTLIRNGERCMYMTTDDLLPLYEEQGGRQTIEVRNSLCPRQGQGSAPGSP